jgi:cobalt transporter subunit CbtB
VQSTKIFNTIPKVALDALVTVFIIGLFIVGFDQGHIFSVIYGESAFADQFLHELTHDMRHAAGFPCH